MKHQDLVKYHQQSLPELNQSLESLSKQWQETKVEHSFNKLKNVHLPKSLRQDIARLKTIIRAKILSGVAVQVETPRVQSSSAKPKKTAKET